MDFSSKSLGRSVFHPSPLGPEVNGGANAKVGDEQAVEMMSGKGWNGAGRDPFYISSVIRRCVGESRRLTDSRRERMIGATRKTGSIG